MMRRANVIFRFIMGALAATFLSTQANAQTQALDCPPNNFLISERTDLLQNDRYRLAFVQTATLDQWNRANQGGGIKVNGKTGLDWKQSKDEGKKEAQSLDYDLTADKSYHLIANKLSEAGAFAYLQCLRNRQSGLTTWLEQDDGDRVKIAALFRPATNDFRIRPFKLRNYALVTSLPERDFIAQIPQTLTFERRSCRSGYIGINIGRERSEILMAAAPPRTMIETTGFSSADVPATQAYRVRHAPPDAREACAPPPAGWAFVPGSAQGHLRVSTTHSNSVHITRSTADLVCWRVIAYTGDRNIPAHAVGFATATLQRTKVLPSQCGG